jgi:SARP family transcriptional regulator, regulator of embCAB operon
VASQRIDSFASCDASANSKQAVAAQDRLNDAVTELRRLTQDELFQALERLAGTDHARDISSVSVEGVRRLQTRSAEHLRLATHLEAAARCCRIIEHELNSQVDALLTGQQRQVDSLGDYRADRLIRRTHRVMSLASWFRMISQHGNSPSEQPNTENADASPATPRQLPVTSPVQSLAIADDRQADISTLMLGPLELSVAGRRVMKWNSLKARSVFQYLLINHGRPVPRDVLMDLHWPNHAYTAARNNLNVALYSLRNILEGPWQGLQPVLYQGGCYALNPELKWWIDREEFLYALSQAHQVSFAGHSREAVQHYQRAVQLYRGRLFEDDPVGDWYLPEQRHLNELYLGALESLGKIYLDFGELAPAAQVGQLALANDPCCEPIHRLLMRCYASENKQQLVSRQYRICVNALRDELGVPPGAETTRLFRALTSEP